MKMDEILTDMQEKTLEVFNILDECVDSVKKFYDIDKLKSLVTPKYFIINRKVENNGKTTTDSKT